MLAGEKAVEQAPRMLVFFGHEDAGVQTPHQLFDLITKQGAVGTIHRAEATSLINQAQPDIGGVEDGHQHRVGFALTALGAQYDD